MGFINSLFGVFREKQISQDEVNSLLTKSNVPVAQQTEDIQEYFENQETIPSRMDTRSAVYVAEQDSMDEDKEKLDNDLGDIDTIDIVQRSKEPKWLSDADSNNQDEELITKSSERFNEDDKILHELRTKKLERQMVSSGIEPLPSFQQPNTITGQIANALKEAVKHENIKEVYAPQKVYEKPTPQKVVDYVPKIQDLQKALDKKDNTERRFTLKQETLPKEEKITIVSNKEGSTRYVQLDIQKLEFEKIERETETISAYSKLMIQNIATFKDTKYADEIEGVVKKYKMILIHTQELKCLLAYLSEGFYDYLLKNIDLNEEIFALVESGKERLEDTLALLNKAESYNEVINPEKNSNYKENIEAELAKQDFLQVMNLLAKYLIEDINSKPVGIISNIRTIVEKLGGKSNAQ